MIDLLSSFLRLNSLALIKYGLVFTKSVNFKSIFVRKFEAAAFNSKI